MSAVLEQERPTNAPQRQPHEYYSPERKAEVLALLSANKGNLSKTANESGITLSTIQYWVANKDRFTDLRNERAVDLALIAENNAKRLGLNISTMDLSEVPLNHQATAFGIMIDKMQLLRGLPTNITESVERQDVTVILQTALSDAIDITPTD